MLTYIANRSMQAVQVMVLVSLAIFIVLRLVPGDPAELAGGEEATVEQVAQMRRDLGLDRPLVVQYVDWVGTALSGDLGSSYEKGVPVTRLMAVALPPTLELAVVAFPLALMVGVPLGAVAGMRPKSWVDWCVSGWTVVGIGVPSFVLAFVLLWLFAIRLDWLPASGRVPLLEDPWGGFKTTLLPAVALATGEATVLARFTRTSVAQVYRADYVRTARAKGLSESRVLIRHALRNALVPVITLAAMHLGHLLTGAVIVEQVFTRPGMGRLMVSAVVARDYAVVQGCLLVLVLSFVAVNLVADLTYGFADPRVRRR